MAFVGENTEREGSDYKGEEESMASKKEVRYVKVVSTRILF